MIEKLKAAWYRPWDALYERVTRGTDCTYCHFWRAFALGAVVGVCISGLTSVFWGA